MTVLLSLKTSARLVGSPSKRRYNFDVFSAGPIARLAGGRDD
jgi:hypothetical protein